MICSALWDVFPSSESPSWESSLVTASVPAKIKLVKEIALVSIAGGIGKSAETRSYVGLRREGELLPNDKSPVPKADTRSNELEALIVSWKRYEEERGWWHNDA